MDRILVIDDDDDLVEPAKGMIGGRHDVVGTTSVSRAMEHITAGGIWLLITDIRMPELNGFQLIQRAKAVVSRLAVLVVSAFYDESEPLSRQVLERYADLALAKPFDTHTLNNAIDELRIGSR
jgi:DNA-binding response OmpR family regulator